MISGRFYGSLKVVRMTDDRVLFPFPGASEVGPFIDRAEAIEAAQSLGRQIVAGDLLNPEL
jgi:hypothetical protein